VKKEVFESTHGLSLLLVVGFRLVFLSVRESDEQPDDHDSDIRRVFDHDDTHWRRDHHHEGGQIREEETRALHSVKENRFVFSTRDIPPTGRSIGRKGGTFSAARGLLTVRSD
jgi:hypothetical protein